MKLPREELRMKKVRIIKRTYPDKQIYYVIQQKHWLLWWLWVDASLNALDYAGCSDQFVSLDLAKTNLCYFDGSKTVDEVIG